LGGHEFLTKFHLAGRVCWFRFKQRASKKED
jgi:hypothetical protein